MVRKKTSRNYITIKDIAKLAEVSVSTVSRVINNNGNEVSKETKEKILRIIEDNNFTPSEMARGLVTRMSKTIGLLIPDILNPYYSEVIKSIETVVNQNGFSLFLCITNESPEREEYYLNEMLKQRTNGLIMLSTCVSNKDLLTRVNKAMHMVSIEADVENVDKVSITNEEGTFEIVKHLLNLGHKKIAFIGYRFDLSGLNSRLIGYKKALQSHDVELRDNYMIEGEAMGNSGYVMTQMLLDLKDRPTAIHCMNEHLASGAYLAIKERGLHIPDDISLTGFDNLMISKIMSPQLTTVSIPIQSVGETAAELLIKNITEGENGIKQTIVLPTQLIIRGSTAVPKQ